MSAERILPLVEQVFQRRMNAIEEAFLLSLRTMIPQEVETTLLFDRGFRRVALVRFLKTHGFHFVIRCPGDSSVWGKAFSGRLRNLKLVRGQVRDLGIAAAYFLVTLAGLAVQTKGLDRHFRANTEKRQTLSLFQLGWKGWRLVRWLPRSWWILFHALDFEQIDPLHSTVSALLPTSLLDSDPLTRTKL